MLGMPSQVARMSDKVGDGWLAFLRYPDGARCIGSAPATPQDGPASRRGPSGTKQR